MWVYVFFWREDLELCSDSQIDLYLEKFKNHWQILFKNTIKTALLQRPLYKQRSWYITVAISYSFECLYKYQSNMTELIGFLSFRLNPSWLCSKLWPSHISVFSFFFLSGGCLIFVSDYEINAWLWQKMWIVKKSIKKIKIPLISPSRNNHG